MTQIRFDISYRIWIEIIFIIEFSSFIYFLEGGGGSHQGTGVDNDITEVIQDPAYTYKDPWC